MQILINHTFLLFFYLYLFVVYNDCNNEKRDKTVLENNNRRRLPIRSEDYIIVHPHFDDYDEHIKVIEVAGYYIITRNLNYFNMLIIIVKMRMDNNVIFTSNRKSSPVIIL